MSREIMNESILNADVAMDEIIQLGNEDVPTITEAFFKNHLLPVLTSDEEHINLDIWYKVAGHPLRPIDVVDNNKNVLFRLPPLMRGDNYMHKSNGYNSIYEIFSTASKKDAVMPNLGTRHIENALLDKIEKPEISKEDLVFWSEILERYGYEPLIKTQNSSGNRKGETVKVDKDIFTGEYEDF